MSGFEVLAHIFLEDLIFVHRYVCKQMISHRCAEERWAVNSDQMMGSTISGEGASLCNGEHSAQNDCIENEGFI